MHSLKRSPLALRYRAAQGFVDHPLYLGRDFCCRYHTHQINPWLPACQLEGSDDPVPQDGSCPLAASLPPAHTQRVAPEITEDGAFQGPSWLFLSSAFQRSC